MSEQTYREGMKQTFKYGLFAGVIGAVGLFVGSMLGAIVTSVGLATAAGVVLALVRVGTPLERLIGFVIGVGLGVGYIYMQLGALPGGATALGNALAIGIVILVIGVVTAVTHRHITAWSMLLGVFAYVSAMIGVIESTPGTAVYEIPIYLMAVLGASLVGFMTVIPVELFAKSKPKPADGKAEDSVPPSTPAAPANDISEAAGPSVGAGIQILDGGK